MAVVGYATIQLIPSLQGFAGSTSRQMAPVVRSVGTDSGNKAGGLFGNSFLGSVGRIMSAAGIYEIGSRVASGLSDAITTGIKGFADLQTYTISFKTLLGSASKANDMIRDLYSFAAKTPFDVEGSVVGAQKLLGVGVAAKDIIPTLTTLGDSTAALGGSTADFNSVLLAYSQIMARGKVSTQDLYQISNTGIPIFQLLSKALGKPVGEIQKLIETGKLASSDVLPKLLAQMNKDYGGAMTGQAGTLNGLWSTFKDTMSQVLTTALTPVAQFLQDNLPAATTAATAAIQWLSDKFGQVVAFFQDPENKFGQTFQPLIDGIMAVDWDTLLGAIGLAFSSLWTAVQPIVEGLATILGTSLPAAATIVSNALTSLFSPITLGAPEATSSMDGLSQKMGEAGQNAGSAAPQVQNLWTVLGSSAGWFVQLAAQAGSFASGITDGKSAAINFSGALTGKFGPAMQSVGLQALALGTIVGSTFRAIGATILISMASSVSAIIRGVASWVTGIASGMAQMVTRASSGARSIVTAITTGLAGVGTAVSSAMGSAISTIASFAAQFFSSGASLINGFVNGIKSGIGKATAAASGIVGAVARFFPHSPAPEGPFSGKGWTLYSGRSLVDGFGQGIRQRQSGLASLMADTFSAPTLAGIKGPTSSVTAEVAATTARAGTYIGSATVNTTNGNSGVIDELNFLLRNLNRGGR